MSTREPLIVDATPERMSPDEPRAAPRGEARSTGEANATPKRATWKRVTIGVLALLYVLSPLDLVPDWFPVIGWLDDLGVLAWAARQVFFKK